MWFRYGFGYGFDVLWHRFWCEFGHFAMLMAPSRHHPNHIFLTFLAKNQILLVKSREMRCLPTSYHNRIFVGFSPESSGATYQNCRFLEFWAGDRILGTLVPDTILINPKLPPNAVMIAKQIIGKLPLGEPRPHQTKTRPYQHHHAKCPIISNPSTI